MTTPIRILLQTTTPASDDDWNIDSFSLLREHLSWIIDDQGRTVFDVTARNRETDAASNDTVLSRLDETDFDELWLFALDQGDGLTKADCRGITRFRQRGGGILTTRDHQDMGSSLCSLGGLGQGHFFHTKNQDPDLSRQRRDDQDTPTISWPNYHSGSNGDYQRVTPVEPIHDLMLNPDSAAGVIEYFPAHPHEGGVGVPAGEELARVIATGVSQVTQRPFNLIVAFEGTTDRHGNTLGRGVSESSFHHLVDYNWDTSKGCPSSLTEPPGNQVRNEPEKLNDVKAYVSNAARWLAPS